MPNFLFNLLNKHETDIAELFCIKPSIIKFNGNLSRNFGVGLSIDRSMDYKKLTDASHVLETGKNDAILKNAARIRIYFLLDASVSQFKNEESCPYQWFLITP
jgi:hypothetical protein